MGLVGLVVAYWRNLEYFEDFEGLLDDVGRMLGNVFEFPLVSMCNYCLDVGV